MVEGINGISSATGETGSAVLNGEFGISCTTGKAGGACVENANCIAVAWGNLVEQKVFLVHILF